MADVGNTVEEQLERRVHARFANDPQLEKLAEAVKAAQKAFRARQTEITAEEKQALGIPAEERTDFEWGLWESHNGVH
jgi:hypothetical protein